MSITVSGRSNKPQEVPPQPGKPAPSKLSAEVNALLATAGAVATWTGFAWSVSVNNKKSYFVNGNTTAIADWQAVLTSIIEAGV